MSAIVPVQDFQPDWREPDPFHVATLLASLGFRIFPTVVQSKIPCIGGWPERATTHLHVIAAWQRRYNANWSILTGRENGNVVIDKDGLAGEADIVELEAKLGRLPPTWRVKSGRIDGGEHIWLRPPPGTDDLRNQQPIPGHAIDVRGWHGHIVVPGSLHKSGNRYSWAPGCAPDEVELAECPASWWDWLPKRIAEPERDSTRTPGGRRASRPARDPSSYVRGSRVIGDGEGGFQNAIFLNAIDWWRDAGTDASEEQLIETLWQLIQAAPQAPGRSIERYRPGNGDLERAVRRARDFVEGLNVEYEEQDSG